MRATRLRSQSEATTQPRPALHTRLGVSFCGGPCLNLHCRDKFVRRGFWVTAHPQRQEIEAAERTLEIEVVPAELRTAADIDAAYQALASASVQAVVVEQSNMLLLARRPIAEAAALKRLPTFYGYREHVDAGGLISYGADLTWCTHRTAYYVDRILKGAKPSDLPIEFPTNIELVINLRTAKALGLTVPSSLLVRADEVIE
jgi:putative tryptophan/tyrosine transport system substrate-binding protein